MVAVYYRAVWNYTPKPLSPVKSSPLINWVCGYSHYAALNVISKNFATSCKKMQPRQK